MSDADIAIRAEGLGKVYRIGLKAQQHDSFVSMAAAFVRSPFSNYSKYRSLYRFDDVDDTEEGRDDIVWALRDASFEIRRGEVVGIIGRNGAGKSTLLKVLTRITPPARGFAEINGRVASLLEVGTGFHHELTGRENVYLNGTVLGMSKAEVDRKFDEIVEFAGVERFLDTPVKRYSSGMLVRLAFAVAAHLEPEILIVDEVLAVGDAEFQKKCIDKMKDVNQQGRTVLFVSHNMPAVSMLCDRALLMGAGRVKMDGLAHDVISHYLNSDGGALCAREWPDPATAPGGDIARLRSLRVVDSMRRTVSSIDIKEEVGIEMTFDVLEPGQKLLPHYSFYNDEGAIVFAANDTDPGMYDQAYPVGKCVSTAWFPGNFLAPGVLSVTAALIALTPPRVQFEEPQVIGFSVRDNMGLGTARGAWAGTMPGVVRPMLRWTNELGANVGAIESRASVV